MNKVEFDIVFLQTYNHELLQAWSCVKNEDDEIWDVLYAISRWWNYNIDLY